MPSLPGIIGRSNAGRLELPKAIEDSVGIAMTKGLGQLTRETSNTGPASDHPEAWVHIARGLGFLLAQAGDSIVDDGRALRYLTDHGVRISFERSNTDRYPLAVTFYNPYRDDETSMRIAYLKAGRYELQQVVQPAGACAAIHGVRTWKEAGADYALLVTERVGRPDPAAGDSVGPRFGLHRLRFDGDHYEPVTSPVPDLISRQSMVRPGARNDSEGFPRLEAMEISPSRLFAEPSRERSIQWNRTFVVHADRMVPAGEELSFAYYGVLGRALEALAARDKKTVRTFVNGEALAKALEKLPWQKARGDWKFESISAEKDTLVCSHRALGRLTLVTADDLRYQRVTDFQHSPSPKP